MKIVPFQKKPDRSFLIKLPALFLAVLATFSACSGSNNTSSTPIPLPNGQAGSLIISSNYPADCFATTTTTSPYLSNCTSTLANGTNGGVTALGTFLSGSSPQTPSLVVGTSGGTVSVVTNVDSTSPLPSFSCTGLTTNITAIAGVYNTSSSNFNIFAAAGNNLYSVTGATSGSCSLNPLSSLTISTTEGPITGLAISGSTLFGVTYNGYYFSIANANSNPLGTISSIMTLPNYPVSGPNIKAMAIDPNGLVFFADASQNTANNGGQITIYHVSSSNPNTFSPNNVQSYSGNNNGVAMSDPIGIAVSETSIPNSNYCSTGSCDYIYLLNIGNSIQQYVMPVPSPINGGVSINPFNLPYTGCEMTDPVAITSFPGLNSAPFTSGTASSGPLVFLGNDQNSSITTSYCTTTPYGNNVVSYGINGQ